MESVLSLLARKNCDKEADEFANAVFSGMDIDDDGAITEEEFILYCRDRCVFQGENVKVRNWKIKKQDLALRVIRNTL